MGAVGAGIDLMNEERITEQVVVGGGEGAVQPVWGAAHS